MHSTSAFKPPSASRTTRDETVHILIYGYNSKEAVWATPQQPGLIEPNKPSEKGGLIHRRTRRQPTFRPVLAFRLAPIPARCPCFTRRPCSPDGHISSNTHARLVLMFHPILKGDRSDTYRARTSGTTPWQESCSMHDFEAPDVK